MSHTNPLNHVNWRQRPSYSGSSSGSLEEEAATKDRVFPAVATSHTTPFQPSAEGQFRMVTINGTVHFETKYGYIKTYQDTMDFLGMKYADDHPTSSSSSSESVDSEEVPPPPHYNSNTPLASLQVSQEIVPPEDGDFADEPSFSQQPEGSPKASKLIDFNLARQEALARLAQTKLKVAEEKKAAALKGKQATARLIFSPPTTPPKVNTLVSGGGGGTKLVRQPIFPRASPLPTPPPITTPPPPAQTSTQATFSLES